MPLQSIGACPSCGARMDMKKRDWAFTCPVCGCAFRHNWRAWVIGIPIAVIVAYGVFQFLHDGTFSAFSGAFVAIIIVSRMGLYRIILEGKEKVTGTEVEAHVPDKKESWWAIVFMTILLVAIAMFFYFAMKGK